MTHLAALTLGTVAGVLAVCIVSAARARQAADDVAAARQDRDSALDALRKAEAARLYAERSLNHWLEKAVSR